MTGAPISFLPSFLHSFLSTQGLFLFFSFSLKKIHLEIRSTTTCQLFHGNKRKKKKYFNNSERVFFFSFSCIVTRTTQLLRTNDHVDKQHLSFVKHGSWPWHLKIKGKKRKRGGGHCPCLGENTHFCSHSVCNAVCECDVL